MTTIPKNKELVKAGHTLAEQLGADAPLLGVAKLVSDISTRLDIAIVRGDQLQSDFTAADNTITSTEAALKSAGIEADTLQDGVMQLVKKLGDVAAENVKIKLCNDVLSEELRGYESDGAFPDPIAHKLWYSAEHPETDRLLAERDLQCRAEGIHFSANRILAAWEAGFIDDTPAQAYDISGGVLSALEFLPNASPDEFKRDYADEVRASIAAQLRTAGNAAKDGEDA